jgi:hypothetical protein
MNEESIIKRVSAEFSRMLDDIKEEAEMVVRDTEEDAKEMNLINMTDVSYLIAKSPNMSRIKKQLVKEIADEIKKNRKSRRPGRKPRETIERMMGIPKLY